MALPGGDEPSSSPVEQRPTAAHDVARRMVDSSELTLTWCVDRNAYADTDECSSEHTHIDVEVDDATGRVLTPAHVQYDRMRAARYFVAYDADRELILWRGQPGDSKPMPVVALRVFDADPLLRAQLIDALTVDTTWDTES